MNDIKTLKWFRQKLYESFPKRRDATLDLIDALSSDHHSESVTQLSLSPFFRRQYNSITKVIKDFVFFENGVIDQVSALYQESMKKRIHLIVHLCEALESPFFYLVSIRLLLYAPMRRVC